MQCVYCDGYQRNFSSFLIILKSPNRLRYRKPPQLALVWTNLNIDAILPVFDIAIYSQCRRSYAHFSRQRATYLAAVVVDWSST